MSKEDETLPAYIFMDAPWPDGKKKPIRANSTEEALQRFANETKEDINNWQGVIMGSYKQDNGYQFIPNGERSQWVFERV